MMLLMFLRMLVLVLWPSWTLNPATSPTPPRTPLPPPLPVAILAA
jgi:hypothetical protein